jgi:YD repeat-containing protein
MRLTTQHVWPGWLGSVSADGTQYRLTWNEWRARQRQHLQLDRSAAPPPRQREIAARAFLAWFDGAAGFRRDPPFDDRELAVRRYMHRFEEVAATRG